MAYILKHCDMDVVRFDLAEAFDGAVVRLIELNNANAHLIPLDMKPDDAGILRWLRRRTIPSNRAYVNNFLAKQGLNEKNTKGVITKRQRDKLRHLLDFHFMKHSRYNLPDERLRYIEDFIHRRVQVLLD